MRSVRGKTSGVWTGYKLDELNAAQMQVVDLINVLVDGKFVQDLKDPALIWRGSSKLCGTSLAMIAKAVCLHRDRRLNVLACLPRQQTQSQLHPEPVHQTIAGRFKLNFIAVRKTV